MLFEKYWKEETLIQREGRSRVWIMLEVNERGGLTLFANPLGSLYQRPTLAH